MSEPSPEQSFSIHLKSLTDFADEFTTQIQSLQAPMDHLATMGSTPPQYGAFHEAWSLGAGEQAAVEEMFNLLGQVKQAIAFAGDVTGTVADGYRNADESIAWALGGPPPSGNGQPPSGNGQPGTHHTWSGGGHWYDDQNPQNQYTDPTQNNQIQPVTATPAPAYTDPTQWSGNHSPNGFGTPGAAMPLTGALLGGAILAGAAKHKSHQPPANTTFDAGFDSEPADGGSALPLWTPPPDPGQSAPWTAASPNSPQGGS